MKVLINVLKALNHNSVEHYIFGLFAVKYYLQSKPPENMPDGEDIDIVVGKKDIPKILELFGGDKFEQITTKNGEIITNFKPTTLGFIEFTLLNDFRLEGIKINLGINNRLSGLIEKAEIYNIPSKIISLDLLITQKLLMFRGKDILTPSDKKDLYDLIKNGIYRKNIDRTLDRVLEKIIEHNNSQKQAKVKSILKQRYLSITA